jgi:clan AA aspartic protease (TIGR02281 family)
MRQLGLAAIAAAACAGIMSVLAAVPPETGGSPATEGHRPPARPVPALPRVPASPGRVLIRADEGSQVYFVNVSITGPARSREFNCIVDTGASFFTINRVQAVQLGFDLGRLEVSHSVWTANGRVSAAAIRLRSVMIAGRVALDDVPALVMSSDDDGCAVGNSLLNRLRMTLENGSLELSSRKQRG